MKAKVNPNLCAGVGACENTCPEVFEVVNGLSHVKIDTVPAELEECCRQAADGCPMNAISLEA